MTLCEKGVATALEVLKDTEASFWDKAEAEAYLRSEMIRPVLWKAGKPLFWEVVRVDGFTATDSPERVFGEWLMNALAEA